MNSGSIVFPHLGLVLRHVGQSVSLFGLDIAYYGIVIALAMLCGMYLSMHLAGRLGLDPDMVMEFGLIAIVVSVMGARVYYVAFNWDYYGRNPAQILNLRGGGLAIYGGVLAGILTAVIYSRMKHIALLQLLDCAVPGLLLGQAIGRWGNFFNREAFGQYTDSLFAMRLPLEAVSPSDVTALMQEHLITVDDTAFIQVHPTFLYESVWNLVSLAVLLTIIARGKRHFSGEIFFLYLLFYGMGRCLIERLRTDQLLWPGTQIAVSGVLSAILAAGAAAVLAVMYSKHRRYGKLQQKKDKSTGV